MAPKKITSIKQIAFATSGNNLEVRVWITRVDSRIRYGDRERTSRERTSLDIYDDVSQSSLDRLRKIMRNMANILVDFTDNNAYVSADSHHAME